MDMEKDYTLNEMKKAISKAAIKYGVKAVYLFGSYARGEETEGSDIDLLIEKGRLSNLLEYFGFISELEDEFHLHIDVVTTKSNDEEFLSNIKKEAVLIYEQEG